MNTIETDAVALLRGWLIRAGCTAFLAAGFCLQLAHFSPTLLADLTGWLVNRQALFALSYIVLASAGLMLASVGPKWKHVDRRSRRISDVVAGLYASTSGALVGWTVCCCIGAAISTPGRIWLALLAGSMVLTVAIAPLYCLLVARITAASFSQRMFPPVWRLNVLRGIGYLLLGLTAFGAWHDLVVYTPVS